MDIKIKLHNTKIFDNNLAAICKTKTTLMFNKPVYVGMCTLELSKVPCMNTIVVLSKAHMATNLRLLVTDTYSLMYEIKTENVYGDFNNNKEMLDFSNYSAMSKYEDDSNALVVGKMNDKMSGISIEEFVGLNPKMYSILVSNFTEFTKARGVNKNVVIKISHNEFKDALLNKNCLTNSMNKIQSQNHRIGAYKINTISLSCFDGKIKWNWCVRPWLLEYYYNPMNVILLFSV